MLGATEPATLGMATTATAQSTLSARQLFNLLKDQQEIRRIHFLGTRVPAVYHVEAESARTGSEATPTLRELFNLLKDQQDLSLKESQAIIEANAQRDLTYRQSLEALLTACEDLHDDDSKEDVAGPKDVSSSYLCLQECLLQNVSQSQLSNHLGPSRYSFCARSLQLP